MILNAVVWIALIERELEGNTLSEALKISTHDEEKLGSISLPIM